MDTRKGISENKNIMRKSDLLIFGDICPDNNYKSLFGINGNSVFDEKIEKLIANSSVVVGNLECPATNELLAIIKCGPSLKAAPKDINYLKKVGFDALSLANNHILDYGQAAVKETIEVCEQNDMITFGAGEDETHAKRPAICEINGKKIGLLSFAEAEFNLAIGDSPGANHFDPYTSFDDIAALKGQCDYVVILYHGGIEYYKNPSPLLQKKCRKMAKAGADLVLCQHSHCIGTFEKVEDCTIIYGQGNTAFGYRTGNDGWNEGLAVGVSLEDKTIDLYLMLATETGIVLANECDTQKRISQMKMDSQRLDDADWIKKEWNQYCSTQEALDLALVYGKGRVFNKLNRILGNRLIRMLYSFRKQMITMNLIRCEAHHEVVQTILENNYFGK